MLLERDPSLEALSAHLREARTRGGRIVMVAGEAGVGKTSLVRAFAATSGVTAYEGACDALSTPRPLGPLVDIAPHIGGSTANLLTSGAPAADIFRSFLETLSARPGPGIVVFEDVHWADDATLDLFRYLGRRIAGTAALVVATYRDDEVRGAHPLRVAMGDLATSAAVHRMWVAPLSVGAVGQLAREMCGDRPIDAGSLHGRTGGNPFFVTEVLAVGATGANGDAVPPTVTDAVLARTARLPSDARALLESASVIGAPAAPSLLARVSTREVPDRAAARCAIETLLDAGFLREDPDGLVFRHELARAAIERDLAPGRRQQLHARVLAVLRTAPVAPGIMARLAHHAEAAADTDAVLRFAPAAAARASAVRGHREAAAQYERALRFAERLEPLERAELLEAWSYECWLTNRIADAMEGRREAADIRRAGGDRRRQADDLVWLSQMLRGSGRAAEAEAAGAAAVDALRGLPPGRELAWAYSNLATHRMQDERTEEAIEWAQRAIDLATEVGDVRTLVTALASLGGALAKAGRGGRQELERSRDLAMEAGLDAEAARAHVNLYAAVEAERHYDGTDLRYADALEFLTERDLDTWVVFLHALRCVTLLHVGRWDEGADLAAFVMANDPPEDTAWIALAVLGAIRSRRGHADAPEALDAALAAAEPFGGVTASGWVRVLRAEAAWLRGDREAAREEAAAGWATLAPDTHPWAAGELAAWMWRTGDMPAMPAGLRFARPYELTMAGDAEAASVEWNRMGCPFDGALALSDSAAEAAQRGALASFASLGAGAAAAMMRRKLRAAGARMVAVGPRAPARGNPFGLTARELEVMKLVAEGFEDREIAERLVLSPRTVSHHVSNVLAKVGSRNRREAARVFRAATEGGT
jgi:DNA-binding CsgD family transcriptional regulator/tetratricopeptide (TPR) repeat protein